MIVDRGFGHERIVDQSRNMPLGKVVGLEGIKLMS